MECSLRRALQGTLAILTRGQSKDLDAPTPCASWDVRALGGPVFSRLPISSGRLCDFPSVSAFF